MIIKKINNEIRIFKNYMYVGNCLNVCQTLSFIILLLYMDKI